MLPLCIHTEKCAGQLQYPVTLNSCRLIIWPWMVWSVLVWSQNDEHCILIQIKTVDFFFSLCPCCQHENHRGGSRQLRLWSPDWRTGMYLLLLNMKFWNSIISGWLSQFCCNESCGIAVGLKKKIISPSKVNKTWTIRREKKRMQAEAGWAKQRCFHHPIAAFLLTQLAFT